jgi:hypothetical protein
MITQMLDHRDFEGLAVWQQIKGAVAVLQASPSGPVH